MKKSSFFKELFGMGTSEVSPRLDESLFLALMSSIPGQSWYTSLSSNDNSFTAGINLPNGTITLQLPMLLWEIAGSTGASLLPLPFSSEKISRQDTVLKIIQFASR